MIDKTKEDVYREEFERLYEGTSFVLMDNSVKRNSSEIKPSKEIWDYYQRNKGEITVDLILTSISSVLAGYHISYSATELLKDLWFLKISSTLSNPEKRTITKRGLEFLSSELSSRYHEKTSFHKIINPL